jgi:hypothetical protein
MIEDVWSRNAGDEPGGAAHPIHDTILRFIADPAGATFAALALEVFAHQFECVPAYREVCARRGATPATVRDWRDIPPVPALAFKHVDLRCGPAQRIFVSSGTTQGPEQRSRHAVPDLRLYHAASLAGLKEFLFPDVPAMPILSLIPSAAERPESSLAQMVAWAIETYGAPGTAVFAAEDRLDCAGFGDALRSSVEPVCIMTTTGALMRVLDHCRDTGWSVRLPHGSRVMDTGGAKGAPRVLSRRGLLQALWNSFAIPGYFVVNEYGMSELSSQYYDNVIRDRHRGRGTHRAKAAPHWLRVRVLDPATLRDVAPGTPGLLCHVDLANAGTALAVLTDDIGREVKDGFEVIGRAAGAEARGCSLALAEFEDET